MLVCNCAPQGSSSVAPPGTYLLPVQSYCQNCHPMTAPPTLLPTPSTPAANQTVATTPQSDSRAPTPTTPRNMCSPSQNNYRTPIAYRAVYATTSTYTTPVHHPPPSPNFYSTPITVAPPLVTHQSVINDTSSVSNLVSRLQHFETKKHELESTLKDISLKEFNNRCKMKLQEEDLRVLQNKYDDKCTELSKARLKLKEVKNYLTTMPTPDEISKLKDKIYNLEAQVTQLTDQNHLLTFRLQSADSELVHRDLYITALKQQQKHEQFRKDHLQEPPLIPSNSFENEEQKNKDLLAENTRLRKLVETCQEKLQNVNEQHNKEITELMKKIYEKDAIVASLRSELAEKDSAFGLFKKEVEQLRSSTTNQQVQKSQQAADPQALAASADKITEVCAMLEALVEFSQQPEDQKDVSDLLTPTVESKKDFPQTLDDQLNRLTSEVEQLRKNLLDNYAQRIGESLELSSFLD